MRCHCGYEDILNGQLHVHVRGYVYDTSRPAWSNLKGKAIQSTDQWRALVNLLYKLGITVYY